MAKKRAKKPTKTKVKTRTVSGKTQVVVVRAPSAAPAKRRKPSVKRRAKRYVKKTAKRAHKYMVKHSGGIITSNKKESLINIGCIGAGFIGSMAVINLAPIPASVKSLKWKGAALAGVSILLALKINDKKAKLALTGAAVYGVVDLLKNYIPQLATLGGYDAQRALVLSGAVQSRAKMSVGGTHGRTTAVGATSPAPHTPSNRAIVQSAGSYKMSSNDPR